MKTTQTWKIGDCLELLPEIPDKSIDMILTDLPYGITDCSWDNTLLLDILFAQYRRIMKPQTAIVLFASQPFTSILVASAPDLFKYSLVWDKCNSSHGWNAKTQPLRSHEDILLFGKCGIYNPQMTKVKERNDKKRAIPKGSAFGGGIKEREYSNNGLNYPKSIIKFSGACQNGKVHPTQKPLELIEYLIKTYTNEGDTVHDSCLGSGTTLEACANLNRNCIGFELLHDWEEHYRKRLKLDNTKLDAWTT